MNRVQQYLFNELKKKNLVNCFDKRMKIYFELFFKNIYI
jgi:hypothetical protein